ncbi:ABC transporter substrate-binding protein [Haloimpatiens lingqiaonensis]|uniref:ABC transporter substrate-binding protein n=1 Tax=Haloimpatiens lingqiaonensis TaxID=1380675 RepID=UPI0010FE5196|nr:ABC transporter substrate-binding protein [Haloimpatiens lingqiaonensis]
MKKMNRKIYLTVILIICIMLVTTSLIYCMRLLKQKENNEDYDFLKDKTIVRVWLPKDKISSTRGYQAKKFNDEHKDIYIMLGLFDNRDYDNILKTSLAAEKGPDIMMYSFFELIKENKIENLNNMNLNKDNIREGDFVYYNKIPVGVRLYEENVKLVWNKEIFKKAGLEEERPPKTWNELVEYSKKIKEKCPGVIPFQFPIKYYEDFKTSIGEPSVNLDNIYTSFWNYEKGEYNFNSAEQILNIYRNMYKEGLINKDFDKKGKNDLRTDFYKGNIAMHLSTFEDKGYFSNIVPLNFEIGICNLPEISGSKGNKSYYLSNSNFLSISASVMEKSDKEKEAVNEVFNWLISQEVNKEVLKTRMALSPTLKNTDIKGDTYREYNDVYNCETETLDPSIFISRNSEKTMEVCIDAIKGKKSIEESIKNLNSMYKEYCNFTVKYRKIQLDSFKNDKNKGS